ncbi:MAG: SDR family NAD(P)-dependent oxidoreductase [Thermoplasmata archaeon]|nr:SDR family NAD(P)-dependent oxidoreductase [Thermoplasmata archaeon]
MENELIEFFKGKTILITGGTGSIGSELTRGLQNYGAGSIRILSNDENGVYELQKELGGIPFRFFVGDVRDKDRIMKACENVNIVFHAAALKHVPLCEYNPFEAIQTNVIGTHNVIEACLQHNVEKMIFISTDKAVEPVNTMGASKLLAERLVIDANYTKGDKKTKFSIVRFGNVMGSRGSVIPLFADQAIDGGPITLTSYDMTRFMMYIQDAVQLIYEACTKARGGEIFSFKMPVIKMLDLAEVIRDEVAKSEGIDPEAIRIDTIGLRPGEKLHEALMTPDEAVKAKTINNLHVIPPSEPLIPDRAMISDYSDQVDMKEEYRSDQVPPISKDEIRNILVKLGLFE